MARDEERGQILPLVCLVIVAAGLAAVGLGRLGTAAAARASASTAADAAALAGAAEGEEAARAVAVANGGKLDSFTAAGADSEVRVVVRGAAAKARATRAGGSPTAVAAAATAAGPTRDGGADAHGLAPAMQAVLGRAEQLLGRPVPVVSGYRSPAQQGVLWAQRAANPFPVAPPGSSMHERGLAVDVPLSFVPILLRVGPAAGLCHPLPVADPVHFEVCGHG